MASTATLVDNDLLRNIKSFQNVKLTGSSSHTVIDCDSAVFDMVDALVDLPVTPPSMYLDIEGISLSGVDDIQLMEMASRTFSKKFVSGPQKCIENDAVMTRAEKLAWATAKEKGMKLFVPAKGGRYDVFNDRPLSQDIIQYCLQDVQFLPRLWPYYKSRMSAPWAMKVKVATEERVSQSQSKHYNGNGKHKAEAPTGWFTPSSSSARRTMGWGLWEDDS